MPNLCRAKSETQAMTSPATIDRVAKAIFARRENRYAGITDIDQSSYALLWPNIDESERTQYRLDAVAAIAAYREWDGRCYSVPPDTGQHDLPVHDLAHRLADDGEGY